MHKGVKKIDTNRVKINRFILFSVSALKCAKDVPNRAKC